MSGPRVGTPLDPRLAAIERLVPEGSVVADVGTDHALLAVRLVESGRAARCLATEPTRRRLAKAASLVAGSAARDRVELREGNGLAPIAVEDGVTAIVVAGLGGHAIRSILDDPRLGALAPRRLVLQPQTEPGLVRRFLVDRGFRLVEERLVIDRRRVYVVLAAEPGEQELRHPSLSADDLLEVGPQLARSTDPAVRRFWEAERDRNRRILDRASGKRAGRGRAEARRREALAVRVLAALAGTRPGR